MTCSYCRYLNSDEERRCRRCGRPISDSFAIATTGSLATVPQVRTEPVGPPAVAPPPPVARRMAAPRQALLFPEKPTGKIIPFEALSTPLFEQPAPKPKSAPRTQSITQPKRAARTNAAQPSLDFLPPAPPETRRL